MTKYEFVVKLSIRFLQLYSVMNFFLVARSVLGPAEVTYAGSTAGRNKLHQLYALFIMLITSCRIPFICFDGPCSRPHYSICHGFMLIQVSCSFSHSSRPSRTEIISTLRASVLTPYSLPQLTLYPESGYWLGIQYFIFHSYFVSSCSIPGITAFWYILYISFSCGKYPCEHTVHPSRCVHVSAPSDSTTEAN